MKKPVKTNVKFKDYSPGQTLLLPPSLDEMIEANHPQPFKRSIPKRLPIRLLK